MSAWTPGPWQVVYHGPSNPIIVTAAPHRQVLSVRPLVDELSYANEVADAYLIAAAPELYEALANLLFIVDDNPLACGDCDRDESGKCAYHELCDAGAAAIAKARGEVQS